MTDTSAIQTRLMIQDIPIVFIVGLGRSGTTLLQEMMDSHPNIVAPPEYSFIAYLYPRYGHKTHWSMKDILEFTEELYSRPAFSVWLINKEELTEKLLSIAEYADYPLLCKTIFYQMRRSKEEVKLLCDKNPENSLFINTLLKIFPAAGFIHIIRDPRDNVNSQIKTFKRKNVYLIAERWRGYNTCVERVKERMPARFHTMHYEELVMHREAVLQSLCNFLNVPFTGSMLENHFSERLSSLEGNKFFKIVKHIHQSLLNPVNVSYIGKWKSEMSLQNVAVTEAITGKLARKYGYEVPGKSNIHERVPLIKRIKNHLHYCAWQMYTKLRYKNYGYNKKYYQKRMKSRPLGV